MTCANLATEEACFEVDAGTIVIEKYCDVCAVKVLQWREVTDNWDLGAKLAPTSPIQKQSMYIVRRSSSSYEH